MAKDNLFEDFTRVASGAFSALSGVRDEVETRIREQVERMLARMDVVTREEFDAVKEMAALAREQQELLQERITQLEAALRDQKREIPAQRAPATESAKLSKKIKDNSEDTAF